MTDAGGPWTPRQPGPPPPAPEPPPPRGGRGLVWIAVIAAIGVGVWALMQARPDRISSDQDWFQLGWLVLLLVFLAGRAAVNRVKAKEAARNLLIWVVIVGAILMIFASRDEIAAPFLRLRSEFMPAEANRTGPHEIAVIRDVDDHFYVMGAVNGTPARFLIDTGASDIVLSPADAKRLGIDVDGLNFDSPYETANGRGYGAAWRADNLTVGEVRLTNVRVSINQAAMSSSLLGQSFLKELDSFEVRGRKLYLRARP